MTKYGTEGTLETEAFWPVPVNDLTLSVVTTWELCPPQSGLGVCGVFLFSELLQCSTCYTCYNWRPVISAFSFTAFWRNLGDISYLHIRGIWVFLFNLTCHRSGSHSFLTFFLFQHFVKTNFLWAWFFESLTFTFFSCLFLFSVYQRINISLDPMVTGRAESLLFDSEAFFLKPAFTTIQMPSCLHWTLLP